MEMRTRDQLNGLFEGVRCGFVVPVKVPVKPVIMIINNRMKLHVRQTLRKDRPSLYCDQELN